MQNTVEIGTSATLIATISAGPSRPRTIRILNQGSYTVYLGNGSVSTNSGYPVASNASIELPVGANTSLYGITATASNVVHTLTL